MRTNRDSRTEWSKLKHVHSVPSPIHFAEHDVHAAEDHHHVGHALTEEYDFDVAKLVEATATDEKLMERLGEIEKMDAEMTELTDRIDANNERHCGIAVDA